MATVQKTTFRRYNGVDWDSIYFSSSADITVLGLNAAVAADADAVTDVFGYGDALSSTDTISSLLLKTINQLVMLDKTRVAALEAGTGISGIDASQIKSGVIDVARLPKAAFSILKYVDSVEKMKELTTNDVQIGDTVQVVTDGTPGEMYYVVSETDLGTDNYMNCFRKYTAGTASAVEWTGVLNKPTTLAGYNISDAVNVADTVNHGTKREGDAEDWTAANKVAKTNADGDLDFNITGSAAKLGGQTPDYYATAAGLSETNDKLQELIDAVLGGSEETEPAPSEDPDSDAYTGDVEDANVGEDAEWGESSETPITWIVVKKDEKSAVLMLKAPLESRDYNFSDLDEQKSKFMENFSADAVGLMLGEVFIPTKEQVQSYPGFEDNAVYTSGESGVNWYLMDGHVDGQGEVQDGTDGMYYFRWFVEVDLSHPDVVEPETLVDRLTKLETLMGTAPEGYDSDVMTDLASLKSGEAITSIAASKVNGRLTRDQLPLDVSGHTYEYEDEELEDIFDQITEEDVAPVNGDLVFLGSSAIYVVVDSTKIDQEAGYKLLVDVAGSTIEWTQIQHTPTTLSGYGITDGVNVSQVIENGIYAEDTNEDVVGKIVKISADKKLHVDISGDAQTLQGHDSEYFATSERVEELALSIPVLLNSVDEFKNPQVGQVVIVPVESTPTTPTPTTGTVTPKAATGTVYSKDVSEICNISVADSGDVATVTGTSEYIQLTEFWPGNDAENTGNFIVLDITPNPTTAVVKFKSDNAGGDGYKTITDGDYILVWKLSDKQYIELLVDGVEKKIDVSQVTRNPKQGDEELPVG